MIVNENSANQRLNSPMNLMNKLKSLTESNPRKSAMSLFTGSAEKKNKIESQKFLNPFLPQIIETKPQATQEPTTLDTILEDNETQIKLGLAHDSALKLLNNSLTALTLKLDDVKADKLPATVIAASKVVESIRKERHEATKSGREKEVHYHFYTPQQKTVADYEVIDVT